MNYELRIMSKKKDGAIGSSHTSYFPSPTASAGLGMLHTSARGFTLVEMIIAFGIFAAVMAIAVGSLVSLMDANRRAQAQKTVANNLHFALENVSRSLRMGREYHCNADVGVPGPLDCPENPAFSIQFLDSEGRVVVYRQDGVSVMRSVGGGALVPVTAPEVEVERLRFFVDGAEDENPARQPRVLILMAGVMKGKGGILTRFDVETLVSQRLLDVVR